MKKKRFVRIIFSLFPLLLASCSLLPQLPTKNSNHSSLSSEETISSSENDRTSTSEGSSSYHVHNFSEWQVSKAATCNSDGTEVRTCSGCRLAQTRAIPTLGHDWSEWYEGAAPTCEKNGSRGRSCLRCNVTEKEDIPALGHDWEIKEIIQEGTCKQDTIVMEVCKRCLKERTNTIPEGGHNYQLVDYSAPLYGYAKVRVYSCTFCEKTYLSFGVDQVTDDSRPHLYYENNEQGELSAKFWGRPIGNDVELYESDGGVYAYQDAHEPVFNENQLGDYFEFSFSLTDKQAALLSNCRLYCDATPAPYLGGMDFWARRESDAEWTPGFYISGERKGELITDYRYCLYVDDTLQYFDPNIKVPAKGRGYEGERSEYVMPYDFHLHSGVNKIRLHMAGGYRSTFYSFTFRTYEEQQQPIIDPQYEVVNEWSLEDIEKNRTDSGWATDKDWGEEGQGFKFNKVGGFALSYYSSSIQKVTFQLKIAVKYQNVNRTGFWKQDGREKTVIKLNDKPLTPPDTDLDFSEMRQSEVNDNGLLTFPEWFTIADLSLIAGENTITVEYVTGGYSYYMCGARIAKQL